MRATPKFTQQQILFNFYEWPNLNLITGTKCSVKLPECLRIKLNLYELKIRLHEFCDDLKTSLSLAVLKYCGIELCRPK